ncbi:MAG TPA: restriction endonuclease subunit S [Candidatus Paceibacterota bacterium]|nr:restriction endonuclease subunit S [Candidatus Paceibacterota bacterium]
MPYPTKKLGEIAEIGAGNSAPQDKKYFTDGTIPFFRTADVGRVHFSTDLSDAGDFLNKEAVKELRLKVWPKNTILFPKSGASTFLNHRVMIGVDGVVSSHLATIFTEDDTLQKYIFYFLTTIDAKKLTADQGYPSLRISDLQKIKIPLPPLNIQKQIVERLDKIAEAQKLNDDLIQKAEELFQSLLHQGLNSANKDWVAKRIGEIAELGRGRVISKQEIESRPGPYPVYSSQTQNEGEFGKIATYDFEGEYVTWTTDGANAGTVFYRNGRFNCTNVCGILKQKVDGIDMKFLAYALNTIAYRYVYRVGNPKLMNNVMAKIKVLIPPLETQKKIVEKLLAVQNYKTELLQQKAKLKELFDSVLYKSFQYS